MFLEFIHPTENRPWYIDTDSIRHWSDDGTTIEGGLFPLTATADKTKFVNAMKSKKTLLLTGSGYDRYVVVDKILGVSAIYSSEATVFWTTGSSMTFSNSTDRNALVTYMQGVSK